MAALSKISKEDIRQARKGGFKRKAPSKPRGKKTTANIESYIVRYNQWVKDAKTKISEHKKLEALKKQIR